MDDRLTRLFGVVKLLVLIAVVSPFLIYAVPQAVGAEASFVVLSGSMAPTLSPGDAIIVEGVPPSQIERGDVITYRDGESPTTHRVVDVRRTEEGLAFTTKGDANEDADPAPVGQEEVIGRVMQVDVPRYGELLVVLPYLGYVVRFTDTPVGFALLVAAPFLLLVATELWSVARAASSSSGSRNVEDPASKTGGPGDTGDPTAPGSGETSERATDSVTTAGQSGAAESDTDSPTYSVTSTDVRLTLGVLVLVVPYTGWVAYLEREGWAVGAAVAAALTFLFSATIFVAGGGESEAAGRGERHARTAAAPDRTGTAPEGDAGPATAGTGTASADGGFDPDALGRDGSEPDGTERASEHENTDGEVEHG